MGVGPEGSKKTWLHAPVSGQEPQHQIISRHLEQAISVRVAFRICGPFMDSFGTILGPFWNNLGPFWDHFGTILRRQDRGLGPKEELIQGSDFPDSQAIGRSSICFQVQGWL